MADVYSGTANVSLNVAADYKQAWLTFLQGEYYYVGFCKSDDGMNVGMNKGTVVQWDRPELLPVATTPMPEFETPAPLGRFSSTPLQATLQWYGDHIMHSDRMIKVALNRSIMAKIRDVQSQQYKNTMDQLCRDGFAAGTQCRYANGASTAEINTVADAGDFDFVYNALRRADVPTIAKRMHPSQLVGTVGIDPAYFALMHVDLEETVKGFTGFQATATYAQPGQIQPGEFGKYRGIRCIASSNGKIQAGSGATGGSSVRETSSNADVYSIVIFGAEAMGQTKLGGKGMDYIVHAAGEGGSEDPHNQRGSAAWHQAAVFSRLQEARLYRIECAAPSLA